jgi:hypothetical protein
MTVASRARSAASERSSSLRSRKKMCTTWASTFTRSGSRRMHITKAARTVLKR